METTDTNQQSGNQNTNSDSDGGFAVPADDPRNTRNRGGLAADAGTVIGGSSGDSAGPGPANMGTTGADLANTDPEHDLGARGTGGANSGQLDVSSVSSISMADAQSGPPGVGPVEGSQSGAVAPRVEMSDVGLVDLNTTDVTADAGDGTMGARVEDADGNPL
ncbi:MAG: hypothetical protein JO316_03025 [Abitibacteriaceae bacterium]|nr:hypothetical protein [Abditibacteriaceae bacterium]MBV9864303.1 hypothetical protein [Abditibacteriaceae bacterium]